MEENSEAGAEPSASNAKPLPLILNGELYEVDKINNNTVTALCVQCKLKNPNGKITYCAALNAKSNLRTHYAVSIFLRI